MNVPTLVFSRRSSSYHGAVLKFWQLDYHLQASAKSMIRTALAAQGWCGRVSGVFWARTPFQFMDGGSVRIPGWATVMGGRSSVQKEKCRPFGGKTARRPGRSSRRIEPVIQPKHRASPRRLLDRPESTTPEAGARPPESIRSGYGGNVPRRRYHFLYLASTRCETARSEEP